MLKINQKIESYFGFLKRANEIVYGVDNFEKKKLYLIIYSEKLSEGSKQRCLQMAKKNNCKCYELGSEEMLKLTNNEKIMAIGAKNEQLSLAIIGQLEI